VQRLIRMLQRRTQRMGSDVRAGTTSEHRRRASHHAGRTHRTNDQGSRVVVPRCPVQARSLGHVDSRASALRVNASSEPLHVTSENYILIVEDDFDIRDTLTQILEEEGYRVEGAENGQDALDRLHAGRLPSLILLDLMMPVMNGWQFRAVQLRDPSLRAIPVVVISANAGLPDNIDSLSPKHLLSKPIQLDRLLDILRTELI
jgi:CheY-like chemotaxis protein